MSASDLWRLLAAAQRSSAHVRQALAARSKDDVEALAETVEDLAAEVVDHLQAFGVEAGESTLEEYAHHLIERGPAAYRAALSRDDTAGFDAWLDGDAPGADLVAAVLSAADEVDE